ncbi:carboxylesterase/lipase family protein [Mycobacterium sp. CBMA271]|uniref:carboxylesterase/lipase family protein n=1 Tax=unclassified Mycobacteroides TaxID=2618759 RepID=UPI00132C6EE2|nr:MULTISPECIES: carboxylesterase/lipase family protein [unclassified Mycobacteroides]MUM19518.1 carboxylesterase [Mycobacteroides sp. CBMA 326]MUM20324.1 carboxylesterase/lipase family protein [Mycobacteroides sp. CBMA 271]
MAVGPNRVKVNSGVVEGFVRRGMRRFRGIPYAEPPVGPLRLRAPRPVQPWQGVRTCRRFGAAPIQPKVFTPQKMRSEDCLTLNVVAPQELPDGPLPVMFYIYGGGYFLGSSSSPPYEGSILARRGCVYVSANYRVGALGAFDLSSLSDGDHVIESNLYLRDLVLALQWVRDNIGAFGGDPDNVTIFGESAGASGVETLMATPAAAGLFHRAIIQSTASGLAATADSIAHDAGRFAELLGATPDNAAATVMNASPRQLLRAQHKLIAEGGFPFGPSVDGDYLPRSPVEAIERGEAQRVPLIIGSNADEARLFTKAIKVMPLSEAEQLEILARGGDGYQERIVAVYPGFPSKDARLLLAGDMFFTSSVWRIAQAHQQFAPVYVYQFDYAPWTVRAVGLKGSHATELPAVFGNYRGPAGALLAGSITHRDASRVVDDVQQRWVAFARNGIPDGDWPQYCGPDWPVIVFDREPRVVDNLGADRREAWAGFTLSAPGRPRKAS